MVKSKKELELCVDPTFKSDLPYNGVINSKWNENGQFMIKGEFPLQFDLECNITCNYDCIMCIRKTLNQTWQTMPLETIYKLIDEAGENKMESIKLQYRGEPLMFKHIIEVIKRCKQNNIFVHFNTNGSLLHKEMCIQLIESGCDKVIISIESMFPMTYEKIRVNGNFSNILNNVIRLRSTRESMMSKTPIIEVFATYQELNKKEIDEGLFQTFWRLFADSITIAECFDLYDNTQDATVLPNWHCAQIWQRLVILVNGDVIPCCAGIDYKDQIPYVLGNIHQNTVKEIWNSEKLNRLRELHTQGRSHEIEMCRKCRLRKSVIKKVYHEKDL